MDGLFTKISHKNRHKITKESYKKIRQESIKNTYKNDTQVSLNDAQINPCIYK